MAEVPPFPVLDVGTIVSKSGWTDDRALKDFGKQFLSALASNRGCYIKGHGLEKDLKEKYMDIWRIFFTQPTNVKKVFERKQGTFFGWIDGTKDFYYYDEQPNEADAFFYFPDDDNGDWPNVDLELYSKRLFAAGTALAGDLFDALSLGLGLEKSFMRNAHKLGLSGANGGFISTRSNYYPLCFSDPKPGHTRMGAHADLGSISFLFQDDVEGLEIEVPGKGFVPVTPVPDTVVVIPGYVLQRWTSDAVLAAKHRVVHPIVDSRRQMPRQSIAFFFIPDKDFEINPVDGSAKYEPVICTDFIQEKCRQIGFPL